LSVEPAAVAAGAGASSPRAVSAGAVAAGGASPARAKLDRGLSAGAAPLSLGHRFVLLPFEERFGPRDDYGAVMPEAEVQRIG